MFLVARQKFLEQSGYGILINCVFTFHGPFWHSCRTEMKMINVRFEAELPLSSAWRNAWRAQLSTWPVLFQTIQFSISTQFQCQKAVLFETIQLSISTLGLEIRVFANGPGWDLGSIPGRVIPKTQKMVLDASLLNTQHYKVRIKGKVEQSRERSSALPYTLV